MKNTTPADQKCNASDQLNKKEHIGKAYGIGTAHGMVRTASCKALSTVLSSPHRGMNIVRGVATCCNTVRINSLMPLDSHCFPKTRRQVAESIHLH